MPEVEIRTLELAEVAGGRHAEMMHDLDVEPWTARIEQRGRRHGGHVRRERLTATPLDAVAEQPSAKQRHGGEHPRQRQRDDESRMDVAPERGEERQPDQRADGAPPLLDVTEDFEGDRKEQVREDVRTRERM